MSLRTRFPFRYGIAALTEAPQVVVRVRAVVELLPGSCVEVTGIAADLLPPKWFTKKAETAFESDRDDMLEALRHAKASAVGAGWAESAFDLWRAMYAANVEPSSHSSWWGGREDRFPALVRHFGVTLVERATIDAVCRATGVAFHRALRDGILGFRPDVIHAELAGVPVSSLLPAEPLGRVHLRHTVGLADPILRSDIPPDDMLHDGLPHALEDCIARDGLQYFKIKLSGRLDDDQQRLRALAMLLTHKVGERLRVTVDGNEQYTSVACLRTAWEAFAADPDVARLMEKVLLIEQPLRRDHALRDEVARDLAAWTARPPIIIDESDATIADLPRALQLGYAGTSHKNCKGVFKGLANACLLQRLRQKGTTGAYAMTAEDLANVGPVALLQDLAVVAAIGIPHVERNGHHYFRGLSHLPSDCQLRTAVDHPDLYDWHQRDAFAHVRIMDGSLSLSTVNEAPFGLATDPRDAVPACAPESSE